ncbi:Alcohol dehydrogenase zinc-binding domain protein [Mycena venus]|uniref:Alcohol dehydrogenase zinc-binding domain protein n=1 Tax=Mycena venus TaxID=2733690 RepID=A0A8H6XDF6_9AGAR|nr:Alcohol dehydrogenase zinc-binding domain protein [Mycena venus]
MTATLPDTMRAIVLEQFGSPEESFKLKNVPTPTPTPGYAIIKVKAFGINHAEMHMRRGEWAEFMPIIGIECVGIIVSSLPATSSSGAALEPGTPVVTLMGGLGRTINGSYAEYTAAPLTNIVPIPPTLVAQLGWARLGALPETYATAWTCLFRNLDLQPGERLLIRGATSSFGAAAVKLAVHHGAVVSATSRKAERAEALRALGVHEVLLEGTDLSDHLISEGRKFDKVLELVGNSTFLGSLKLVRRDGKLCLAGFLGGLAPVEFNPLLQMASGVHFSFFGSFVFGNEEFPLTDVPLAEIADLVASGKLEAEPKRVFDFGESGVREAHRVMEAAQAAGKMVVVVDSAQ